MLRQQEILALKQIFRDGNKLSSAIKDRIDEAVSIDWEETGVGFYSTIRLNVPLDKLPDVRMWEYNFSHPDFPYGGSFMCTVVSESELELEAVTLGGAAWPRHMDPEQLRELD